MIHWAIVLLLLAFPAAAETWRFDMGTPTSPVAPGFTRVGPDAEYRADRRFGWESRGQTAFDVARPPENPSWKQPSSQVIPQDYVLYKEHNDVTRDGVRSTKDLIFRADVPNGVYRVAITVGNLEKPICSEQIFVNDTLLAPDVHAKHFVQRGRPDFQYGFFKKVRGTVTVTGGVLRFRIHGDDSKFRAAFEAEYAKPAPTSYLIADLAPGANKPPKADLSRWGVYGPNGVWVWQDIGGPFTENSVNAIEIYPYIAPPVFWSQGRLQSGASALRGAADHFNAGRWAEAEAAFAASTDEYATALGYLWLAGRPQIEEERRLLSKALPILKRLASSRAADLMFQETLEGALRMERALYRFDHRADQQRTYTELLLILGEVDSMQPDDPLYYKGRIYAARGLYMIIPHRWSFSSGAGRQIFEELDRAGFGSTRYVSWYLRDQWSNKFADWRFADYSVKKKGAPAWAAEIYEAYNREVDLAEWWIRNRQKPDGSLGGSWGDDVEVLRSFGAFAGASLDASPLVLDGIRKVADGAWHSGSIDTDAGYFSEVGDTEHSGEWTADTLVAMIRTDYGNPVYIERALKTGKLMRDLWMDTNSKGHFLMRSNFLGAAGVGDPATQNDSRINYRPASPAFAVLQYNRLPELQRLFVAWADAWLAASLSTEKGKPRGVIPQEIGFDGSEMGGVKAPTWYKAFNPSTKEINYDWEGVGGYHEAMVDLFVTAYRITGDRKYLEPMDLEAAFAREHCPRQVMESEHTRAGRLHASQWNQAREGSNEWIAGRLAIWPKQWDAAQRSLFPDRFSSQPDRITLAEAAAMAREENEWAAKRWPHVTTECIATDRIYWRGMGNALRLATAYGVSGQAPMVGYRGLGRDFAAVVLKTDAASLKVILYNMDSQEKQAAVVPWQLNPGDEYSFRAGPASGDGTVLDRAAEERRVRLKTHGQEVGFRLPGRTAWVVELSRVSTAPPTALEIDVALSANDVRFVAEYRRLDVTVHNIGAKAARKVVVVVLEDGKEIGRETIPHIAAPLDLDPKSVRIGIPFEPKAARHTFTVIVDPDGALEEITKRNNKVTVEVPTPAAPRKQHSSA